jgi:glycosyltransferase involved in cell wall biosynthesis
MFLHPAEEASMRVLTFSSLWPNPMQPLHGLLFGTRQGAQRILLDSNRCPGPLVPPRQMVRRAILSIYAVPRSEKQGLLEVTHPRYLVLPKIMKWLDGWLMYASLRNRIRQIQLEFPFDLIDAHWAYPDGFAASRIANELSVPFTITVRGSDINVFAQETLRRGLIRQALREAQHVICVARPLKESVIKLGIGPDKIAVVENGIDPMKFYPVPREEARLRLQLSNDAKL